MATFAHLDHINHRIVRLTEHTGAVAKQQRGVQLVIGIVIDEERGTDHFRRLVVIGVVPDPQLAPELGRHRVGVGDLGPGLHPQRVRRTAREIGKPDTIDHGALVRQRPGARHIRIVEKLENIFPGRVTDADRSHATERGQLGIGVGGLLDGGGVDRCGAHRASGIINVVCGPTIGQDEAQVLEVGEPGIGILRRQPSRCSANAGFQIGAALRPETVDEAHHIGDIVSAVEVDDDMIDGIGAEIDDLQIDLAVMGHQVGQQVLERRLNQLESTQAWRPRRHHHAAGGIDNQRNVVVGGRRQHRLQATSITDQHVAAGPCRFVIVVVVPHHQFVRRTFDADRRFGLGAIPIVVGQGVIDHRLPAKGRVGDEGQRSVGVHAYRTDAVSSTHRGRRHACPIGTRLIIVEYLDDHRRAAARACRVVRRQRRIIVDHDIQAALGFVAVTIADDVVQGQINVILGARVAVVQGTGQGDLIGTREQIGQYRRQDDAAACAAHQLATIAADREHDRHAPGGQPARIRGQPAEVAGAIRAGIVAKHSSHLSRFTRDIVDTPRDTSRQAILIDHRHGHVITTRRRRGTVGVHDDRPLGKARVAIAVGQGVTHGGHTTLAGVGGKGQGAVLVEHYRAGNLAVSHHIGGCHAATIGADGIIGQHVQGHRSTIVGYRAVILGLCGVVIDEQLELPLSGVTVGVGDRVGQTKEDIVLAERPQMIDGSMQNGASHVRAVFQTHRDDTLAGLVAADQATPPIDHLKAHLATLGGEAIEIAARIVVGRTLGAGGQRDVRTPGKAASRRRSIGTKVNLEVPHGADRLTDHVAIATGIATGQSILIEHNAMHITGHRLAIGVLDLDGPVADHRVSVAVQHLVLDAGGAAEIVSGGEGQRLVVIDYHLPLARYHFGTDQVPQICARAVIGQHIRVHRLAGPGAGIVVDDHWGVIVDGDRQIALGLAAIGILHHVAERQIDVVLGAGGEVIQRAQQGHRHQIRVIRPHHCEHGFAAHLVTAGQAEAVGRHLVDDGAALALQIGRQAVRGPVEGPAGGRSIGTKVIAKPRAGAGGLTGHVLRASGVAPSQAVLVEHHRGRPGVGIVIARRRRGDIGVGDLYGDLRPSAVTIVIDGPEGELELRMGGLVEPVPGLELPATVGVHDQGAHRQLDGCVQAIEAALLRHVDAHFTQTIGASIDRPGTARHLPFGHRTRCRGGGIGHVILDENPQIVGLHPLASAVHFHLERIVDALVAAPLGTVIVRVVGQLVVPAIVALGVHRHRQGAKVTAEAAATGQVDTIDD